MSSYQGPPPPPGQPPGQPPQAYPPQPGYPAQPQQAYPPQPPQQAYPPQPQVPAFPAQLLDQPGVPPQGAQPGQVSPPYWPADQTPPHVQQAAPQQPPQAAAAPQGMPVYYAPDAAATDERMAQQEREAQARQNGSQFSTELKFPGPDGTPNWQGAPSGFESFLDLYLCGGWAPGVQVPFVETTSHFYKSPQHPKGNVIACTGEGCHFCAARKLAFADPALEKSAQQWGRISRRTLYNVINLSDPQSHTGPDGKMRPFIFSTGVTLQKDFKKMFAMQAEKIQAFCHPTEGRPIRVTKKKTGSEALNVEYGANAHDRAPLDPFFYPALANLWDLQSEIEVTPTNEIYSAIQELGWPVPESLLGEMGGGLPSQGAPPTSGAPAYNPGHQPPAANPYGQQPPQQLPQQAYPQQQLPGYVPPQGPAPGAFPQQPPQQAAFPAMVQPPMAQPPMGVPAMGAPPMGAPAGPPPMAPPPVTSTGQGIPPPPGIGGPPMGNPDGTPF